MYVHIQIFLAVWPDTSWKRFRLLLDSEGQPGDVYNWEFQNTITGRWYNLLDRAIHWVDGGIVRIEMATDISEIKETDEALKTERDNLHGVSACSNQGLPAHLWG